MNLSLAARVLWAQFFRIRRFRRGFKPIVSVSNRAPNERIQVNALEGHVMHRHCLRDVLITEKKNDKFRFLIGKV